MKKLVAGVDLMQAFVLAVLVSILALSNASLHDVLAPLAGLTAAWLVVFWLARRWHDARAAK